MSVRYELRDHVARVTIDRPEVLNAIDAATETKLQEIWSAIEEEPEARVAVLTGAGDKAFSVGADMKSEGAATGLEYWAMPRSGGFGGIALRATLDIPVIARVNGYALGGGFEMVLGCDVVVACDDAQFGFPEPQVGRMPLDGGMVLLPRLVPEKWAMGVLLTGRRVSAAEAHQVGLVNEVVPRSELDACVERWVSAILACAPLSLRAIKQSVKRTGGLSPVEAQALRLDAVVRALQSEDGEEGVRAFRGETPAAMARTMSLKTFPLRGVKDSPPYLHDGRLLTLDDTVEFFNIVLGTKLTEPEKKDLIAFLRAL